LPFPYSIPKGEHKKNTGTPKILVGYLLFWDEICIPILSLFLDYMMNNVLQFNNFSVSNITAPFFYLRKKETISYSKFFSAILTQKLPPFFSLFSQ